MHFQVFQKGGVGQLRGLNEIKYSTIKKCEREKKYRTIKMTINQIIVIIINQWTAPNSRLDMS